MTSHLREMLYEKWELIGFFSKLFCMWKIDKYFLPGKQV